MPRIRCIKPEFFSDEKLSPLDPTTRLVFLGLVSMADDFGRLLDNEKIIDAFIFPNSSENCRESLATLSRTCRIRRGKASNGAKIIEIVNWDRHQKVDKPNRNNCLPRIEEKAVNNGIPESVATDSRAIRDDLATDLGSGSGSGSKELRSCPVVMEFPTNGKKKSWDLTEEFLEECKQAFPGLDVLAETRKALAWLKANRLKTAKGMPRFLNSWLSRANDRGGGRKGEQLTFTERREANNLAVVSKFGLGSGDQSATPLLK